MGDSRVTDACFVNDQCVVGEVIHTEVRRSISAMTCTVTFQCVQSGRSIEITVEDENLKVR